MNDHAGSKIRPATAADAPAVTSCVDAAYRPYVRRIGKPPAPMVADYAEVIRQHRVHVIEADGIVAGMVVLITNHGHATLDTVAVDPAYQHNGLGRALIAFAEQTAAALGYTTVELYTHALMTENIALYSRLGYSEFARKSEQGYYRVYMRKAPT